MDFQQTLRRPVSLTGIGLHSGEPAQMTVSPAGADTGIVFRAADGTLIPGNADHVVDTNSATTVGAFGVRVDTLALTANMRIPICSAAASSAPP